MCTYTGHSVCVLKCFLTALFPSSIALNFLNESLITIELAVGVARIKTNGALVYTHVLGIVCVS